MPSIKCIAVIISIVLLCTVDMFPLENMSSVVKSSVLSERIHRMKRDVMNSHNNCPVGKTWISSVKRCMPCTPSPNSVDCLPDYDY